MDPCYEIIADQVDESDWNTFSKKLLYGFKGFPDSWQLSDEIRERLVLRIQWHFFNPDLCEGMSNKRVRAWAFMASFLSSDFQRKFNFLRSRLDDASRDKWDGRFSDFETLLLLSSMTVEMQQDWLSNLDGVVRYGESKRAKVIKNKGVGLSSQILGVNILMDWAEIKTRYRYMMKMHHPDVGGDPKMTSAIVAEYERLKEEHRSGKRQSSSPWQ